MAGIALYAHQGGWDEVLFVLAPLVIFAVLLLMARRRVDRMQPVDDETAPAAADTDVDGP